MTSIKMVIVESIINKIDDTIMKIESLNLGRYEQEIRMLEIVRDRFEMEL